MAADRSVAPSAARLRQAQAAGLRPRSVWLPLGALLLVAWAAAPVRGAPPPLEGWVEAFGRGEIDRAWLRGGLTAAGGVAAAMMAMAISVRGLVIAGTSGLGPGSRARLQALGVAPTPRFSGLKLLLAALVAAAALGLLLPVVAGAARAPAGSWRGLAELWLAWADRWLLVSGSLLTVAGAVELVLARHGMVWALHQSVAQARDERRRGRATRR